MEKEKQDFSLMITTSAMSKKCILNLIDLEYYWKNLADWISDIYHTIFHFHEMKTGWATRVIKQILKTKFLMLKPNETCSITCNLNNFRKNVTTDRKYILRKYTYIYTCIVAWVLLDRDDIFSISNQSSPIYPWTATECEGLVENRPQVSFF